MDKAAQNIQDVFLNTARKERLVLTLYLLSGVKLSGRIRSFDKYCLVLESNNQEQMIFKHAIATIQMPRAATRATETVAHTQESAVAAVPVSAAGQN